MPREPQAIAWDPLPRGANRYMELDVVHFEQLAGETGVPIALTVTAPLRTGEAKQAVATMWRLTFLAVEGFRMLPIDRASDYYAPWPPPTDAYGKPALWEVVHSHWLEQTVSTFASRPQSVHHYVIASSDDFYEIAAQWWEVEDLGEFDQAYAALDLGRMRRRSALP